MKAYVLFDGTYWLYKPCTPWGNVPCRRPGWWCWLLLQLGMVEDWRTE